MRSEQKGCGSVKMSQPLLRQGQVLLVERDVDVVGTENLAEALPKRGEHLARLGELAHPRVQEPQGVLEVKSLRVIGAEGDASRVPAGEQDFQRLLLVSWDVALLVAHQRVGEAECRTNGERMLKPVYASLSLQVFTVEGECL